MEKGRAAREKNIADNELNDTKSNPNSNEFRAGAGELRIKLVIDLVSKLSDSVSRDLLIIETPISKFSDSVNMSH